MSMERLRDELVSWIKSKVTDAGAQGTVVGLSGGIDSAVVAALCQRAFPEHNIGVMMPIDSSPIDAEYAELAARRIGMSFITVDLTSTWREMVSAIESPLVDAPENALGLARANVKPRLRMAALYYVAARFGALVVGTENLPEITVGYSTKFGDGAADLMPMANLLKSEVRGLAKVLDVPQEIIDRPPTAGLWEGQTDEDEMGLTYDELDKYLLTGEARPEVKDKIESLNKRSSHKRMMPPSGPSPRS